MVFEITLISRDENQVITRTIMYNTSGTVKNACVVSVRTQYITFNKMKFSRILYFKQYTPIDCMNYNAIFKSLVVFFFNTKCLIAKRQILTIAYTHIFYNYL